MASSPSTESDTLGDSEEERFVINLSKCDRCDDGVFYTEAGLRNHKIKEHHERLIVTVDDKPFRFRCRPKERLFPCFCGVVLNVMSLRRHTSRCAVCKEIAAKAKGDKPIDVFRIKDLNRSANTLACRPVDDASIFHVSSPEDELSDTDIEIWTYQAVMQYLEDDAFNSIDPTHTLLTNQAQQARGVLLEPNELRLAQLAIHRKHKIILCRKCKTIVPPSSVEEHLHTNKHAQMLDPENKDVINYINKQKWLLSEEQIEDWVNMAIRHQRYGPALSELPILKTLKHGLKCTNCGLATVNRKRAIKHIEYSRCRKADAALLTDVTLQRLDNTGSFRRYIHVDTDPLLREDSASAIDLMANTIWLAAQAHRDIKCVENNIKSLDISDTVELGGGPSKRIRISDLIN